MRNKRDLKNVKEKNIQRNSLYKLAPTIQVVVLQKAHIGLNY